MDPVPQSSFIPRQGGNMVAEPPRKRGGSFNLLSFFSMICFFGSILLALGVYFLEHNHEQKLAAKKTELSAKRSEFKQDTMDSIRALDTRIRTAEYLLDNHISPSALFAVLERTTQEHIQYTAFDFSRRSSGNVSVSMVGIAPHFNTVARQKQRLEDEGFFNRVIFSNLDKPSVDHVTFKIDIDISKDKIAYNAPDHSVNDLIENAATSSPAQVNDSLFMTGTSTSQSASSSVKSVKTKK